MRNWRRVSELQEQKVVLYPKYILFTLDLLVFSMNQSLHAQLQVDYTQSNKVHDIGNVKRVINGGSWYVDGPICEYPIRSGNEHMVPGENRLQFVCLAPQNDTLKYLFAEDFRSDESGWGDSIWEVENYRIVDLPFWHSYEGVSEQDFVFRKRNDYIIHRSTRCDTSYYEFDRLPMYIDVIEQSFAWSEPPLSDILLYAYKLVPTKFNLRGLYLGLFFRGGIGKFKKVEPGFQYAENYGRSTNDQSVYYKDEYLALVTDGHPGYWGPVKSYIGYRLFPPVDVSPDDLTWTFDDNLGVGTTVFPCQKTEAEVTERMYKLFTSGKVEIDPVDYGTGYLCVGPFNVNVGDTLAFWSAELLGMGMDDIRWKSDLLDKVLHARFHVPKAPPSPPLRVQNGSKQVTLRWDALPGQIDPEKFKDPNRSDGMDVPFEGYRVYKSMTGLDGPWTLLAEYDIPNNGFGLDLGLAREYTDTQLLNGCQYFYAVTSFSKRDTVLGFPPLESRIPYSSVSVTTGTPPPEHTGKVSVVPNPYRSDISYYNYTPAWETPTGKWKTWYENDRRIQFINLPERCEIKIYTLAGDIVITLHHNDPIRGFHDWNLTSYIGLAVSSGIYLFTVQDQQTGEVQAGKFVILR